jgi:hypothetical protein
MAVAEVSTGAQPDPERVERYAEAFQQYVGWADTLTEKYPVK